MILLSHYTGDTGAPLAAILKKLTERGYSGPISVELFLPKHQEADPYELAKEIRRKSEAVFTRLLLPPIHPHGATAAVAAT